MPSAAAARPGKRRVRKRLFKGTAALAIVLFLSWGLLTLDAAHRLRAAQDAVRTAGHVTRLEELEPPPPPGAENAAESCLAALQAIAEVKGDPPLALAPNLLKLNPKEQVRAQRILAECGEAFDLVRRGRKTGPSRYRLEDVAGAGSIHHSWRLQVFLVLQIDSLVMQGRSGDALECFRDLLACAGSQRTEPFLNSQKIWVDSQPWAAQRVGCSVTPQAAGEELQGWLDALPVPAVLGDAFLFALQSRLAMATQWSHRSLRQFANDLMDKFGRVRFPGDHLVFPHTWRISSYVYSEALWKLSAARCLHHLLRMIDAGESPYLEARRKVAMLLHDCESSGKGGGLLSWVLLPGLLERLDRITAIHADLAAKREGLEWELARIRTGSYPKEPRGTDPFTGKPLIFDAEAGVLRSAGPPPEARRGSASSDLLWQLRRHKSTATRTRRRAARPAVRPPGRRPREATAPARDLRPPPRFRSAGTPIPRIARRGEANRRGGRRGGSCRLPGRGRRRARRRGGAGLRGPA